MPWSARSATSTGSCCRPRAICMRRKKAILVVEEGQPEFIEQAVNTILRRADIQTKIHGKDFLPMAGEYTGGVMREGIRKFITKVRPDLLPADAPAPDAVPLKQRENK